MTLNMEPYKDMPAPIQAAWRHWFAVDFSWEGLKERRWPDGLTLQDYWLINPKTGKKRTIAQLKQSGELIEAEGQKTYHLVHLPLFYEDGTPTLKTTDPEPIFTKLLSLIMARLEAAAPLSQDENEETLKSKRAFLDGVVLADIDLSKDNFKHDINATFNLAIFSGNADFINAAFSGDADFLCAAFSGYAFFNSAAFSGDANFSRAALGGNANFSRAAFSGDAYFQSAAFSDYASFRSAAFSGYASFYSAAFSGSADFQSAIFGGSLSLNKAVFVKEANFSAGTEDRLRQSPKAMTWSASDKEALEGIKDEHVQSRNLWYDEAERRRITAVDATEAIFLNGVSFVNRDLMERSSFDHALIYGIANFDHATLKSFVTFDGAKFETAYKVTNKGVSHVMLSEATLRLIFSRLNRGQGLDFEAWKADFQKQREAYAQKQFSDTNGIRGGLITNYFIKLESAYRTLKQHMEERRDRVKEGEFFIKELQARYMRPDIRGGEKFVSSIYGFTSNYGVSMGRPLWCILWLIVGFTLINVAFLWEGVSWDTLWLGLRASASRMFPFGGFGDATTEFANLINNSGRPWWALLFMGLATLESFCALTLAFLFGLAMRRKFQIN